jgi:outer membrane protein assembly factor BamB
LTPIAIGYTIVNINGDLGLTGIGPKDTPWPMKCHDNRHTGRSPYSTAHIDGTEKWRFPLYYRASNDPIIDDDGTIYIMGEYEGLPVYLYAINPDGTEKWKFGLDGQIIGSTAVIGEDGTIYIGSWDCRLYALNPNGALKWTFHAGSSIATSPAIAEDGTIYFGTMLSGNKIFAVNPDGSKKWHYQAGDSIHSDPAIGDDGTIYIGSRDNFLYALYPNGDLRWRFEAQDVVKGSPSIADDGTIYVGSFDGYLYAINPDGNKKWECNLGSGTETNPSIASDGTIYIGGVDLWAVNPDDGTIKWTFDLGSNRLIHQSSPTISSDGTIYVGLIVYDSGDSVGAEILAVSSEGAEKWRKRIGNLECQITPGIASDGTVYIGSSSLYSSPETGTYGYLHAFGPLDTNAPLAPMEEQV